MQYVNVHDVAKEYDCIIKYDGEMHSDVIDEECLKDALIAYAKQNKNCVIDGHIAQLLPKEHADVCIITTCDKKQLRSRMKMRGYSGIKIKENIDAMNFFVIEDELKEQGYEPVSIDTTHPNEEKRQELIDKINKIK